jgi:hypothetical protein
LGRASVLTPRALTFSLGHLLDEEWRMTPEELKKEREALIANPKTGQMTAQLKEIMDQSPPDPDQPHQERERILAEWRSRYTPPEMSDPMLAAAWERIVRSWFDNAYDGLLIERGLPRADGT